MSERSLVKGEALWQRAERVIPRGVYGHQNAGTHGARHPKFLARGEGSRVWDVDGNEYVDWMCGYGPMVVGYRNPVVDRAVAEQMELADTMSLPGEPMVEYGFKLEKAIADRATPIIVGYANGHVGYIATADAYTVGGYEPNTSKLAPEAEPIILVELGRLADRVVGDVFESFSKHPQDVKKREELEKARLKKKETP